MKNKKAKIIAFALVFALVLSTVIISTVANTKTTEIEIQTSKTQMATGETATISVNVTTNYPVALMSIPIFYDKTLVTISDATTTISGYKVANVTTESESVDSAKVFDNTGLDSSKYGFVLVTYIGGANQELADSINGAVLTFNVTAKADVSGSAVIKAMEESIKDSDNVEGMLYFGYSESNTLDSIPENVESIDVANASTQIEIIAGGPELSAIAGKAGVVDNENGYVYGFEAGTTNFNDFFTVSNGGSFELVANESGYTNGTGAKIVVKNSSGTQVAEYILIVFGDVNGDGQVTGADGSTVTLVGVGATINGEANNFAADVNGDGEITGADGSIVTLAGIGGDITINPYA